MIYTLTLNPAIDKILYVDFFQKNITTRINKVVDSIGGKGTHVSINLRQMGDANSAVMITHGSAGRIVEQMMRDFGVDVLSLHRDSGMTRTNYLLSESRGDNTLITEKGAPLSEQDITDIIALMNAHLKDGDILVIAGDASNHPDLTVYQTIIAGIRPRVKYFLDTSGGYLRQTMHSGVFAIKPNLDELSMICERPIEEEQSAIVTAMQELESYQIPLIAVSLGGDGSIVKYEDTFFRVHPPMANVQNTVGCGDCYMAGLVHGFAAGLPIEDVLRYATATSAAKAECELSVGFDPRRAQELALQVQIQKI